MAKTSKRFKDKTSKTRPKPVARKAAVTAPGTLPPAVPIAQPRRMDA